MKKVLIMTPDIEGPVRNGGIGTAFTALATTLAKKGYDVDVLYTCGDYSESSASTFSDWSRIYSTFGINLLSTGLVKEINIDAPYFREGANKQVISSQADSLIKISRIWADFFPANTSNQPI